MKLSEYKEKKMQDPDFANAYAEIQPEMNVIRALIDARASQNMTQKELSDRTGIAQTEISKLENGIRNPSIKLLQKKLRKAPCFSYGDIRRFLALI